MSTEYKVWGTLHEGSIVVEEWPALALVEFRHDKPIHSCPVIGDKVEDGTGNQWWRRVSSLNDAGDPAEPASCGYFGYLHVWDAMVQGRIRARQVPLENWFIHPLTEAEYGTHVAFETLPVLRFLTKPEWDMRLTFHRSVDVIRRQHDAMT